MKRKTTLFVPIFWTIIGCLWVLIFCADFYAPPDLGLLMVLHGLCASVGVVNIIVQWIRYKKVKVSRDDEGQGECL